jgi:hypothetical protein
VQAIVKLQQILVMHAFELWVAIAAIVGAIVYFVQPLSLERSGLSEQIGFGLAVVWNSCYLISGLLIVWGILHPSPRFRIAGLSILGATVAVNGISVLAVFGSRGAVSAITFLMLAAASWSRAISVYRTAVRLASIRLSVDE